MGSVVALHSSHVIIGDDFWVDASTGVWETDCQIGRQRAELFTGHIGPRDDIYPYFIQSMKALVEKGRFTGVEVGFFQRLMELAIAVPEDARRQGL